MNTHKLPSLAAVPLLLATCILCAAVVAPVGAQSSCVYVRVVNGLTANVRSGAGADFPTVANSINYASGEKISCENANGWYRISDPVGWVSSTYSGGLKLLNIRAVSVTPSPTPTRTATRTATVGASATASPTPTRVIVTATPNPVATQSPYYTMVVGEDGKLRIDAYCPQACAIVIEMENLP